MKAIRIIGRSSRLSMIQMEKVKQRIRQQFPEAIITLVPRSSKGDALQDVPLQTVEGTDFFTQEIFDALRKNEADIAVHSLKDMSGEHFFSENRFAVVDRDETRDIAIFHPNILGKLKDGATITIGTCSPRREEMAIGFLQKALPQTGNFKIKTAFIRGNVDTRLRKLDNGEYDGIILAVAGLNRLLESKEDAGLIRLLLNDKKLMLLPLVECVPAPCQGAIVAEAHPDNKDAVVIVNAINNMNLMQDCVQEKKAGLQYGAGCLQRFGVTTLHYGKGKSILYAAGRNNAGDEFTDWKVLPKQLDPSKRLFSSTDHMGHFFEYEFFDTSISFPEHIAYIANYKALQKDSITTSLKNKKIWASGTKTWFEIAKKGLWVEGCADAMGIEFLKPVWKQPLTEVKQEQVRIISHQQAVLNWQEKGWKASATYKLKEQIKPGLSLQLQQADAIFWTSFQQYQLYHKILKKEVQHLCPSGETAQLLKAAGIKPTVFPNIKAFNQWRNYSSHLLNVD